MMLQLVPRLQNRRMHLLHAILQLHPKPTQNIMLPRIILGVHPRLHLLVINRTLRTHLGRIERGAGFLDFC
jgi:hypothetical protein